MSTSEGIYVQNQSKHICTATLGPDCRLILKPFGDPNGRDIGYVPIKYVDHMVVRKMIARESVKVVDPSGAEAAQKATVEDSEKKRAERHEATISKIDTAPQEDYIQRQCCGVTAAGTRCKRNVNIKVKDFEAVDGLVFCKAHEDSDRESFTKNDEGEWEFVAPKTDSSDSEE